MQTLPKYLQNANLVIEKIAGEPERVWTRTQKELGEELNLSQPELSLVIKCLRNMGRITYGPSLPGVRGKNHTLILSDPSPLTEPLERTVLNSRHNYERSLQRPLNPGEEAKGVFNLRSLSHDQIGAAIVRVLQDALNKEERFLRTRAELSDKIRYLTQELYDERNSKIHLARMKDQAERELAKLEEQTTSMREEINKLILKAHNQKDRNSYPIAELLTKEELQLLENLTSPQKSA